MLRFLCLKGRLEARDWLATTIGPFGTEHAIRAQVADIRINNQKVDSLGASDSGDVLCGGSLGPARVNWEVVANRP